MSVGRTFQLGEKIGSGAFSYVFKSHDTSTGRVVALKKSRVSLKVQRTILHYEARILRLLAGHPSIPAVFAYGRFEHFEYLAIELLGCSLGSIVEKQGRMALKSVLQIGDQMLSALEHIHSRRIVHRDIKPNNIMTRMEDDLSVVYLIDFGIARPCQVGEPAARNLIEERRNIVGTLTWASLNAHEGIDLSPRDDLESLAYTLVYLLLGELPWRKHCEHGTVLGRIAQVREKKRAWTGSRLTDGHFPLFGRLLDYARGLNFNEPLDYGLFRSQFQALQHLSILDDDTNMPDPRDKSERSHNESPKSIECPVEVGQLVLVKIVPRTSIEGYSIQTGDPSYWYDPALSSDKWRTCARPAIVINTSFDHSSALHKIQVVSLGRGTPAKGTNVVPVFSPFPSPVVKGKVVVPEPTWPMPETYCYAFPRATEFHCLPCQSRDSAHWKISLEDVRLLREKFAVLPPWYHRVEMTREPDTDIRYDKRMKMQAAKFFVEVTALMLSNLNTTCADVDWQGDRGWFDERVRIAKRRGQDDGFGWDWTTSHDDPVHEEDERSSVPDSYYAADYSLWGNRQQERDHSLTLALDQEEHYRQVCGKGELESILAVI